jgi:signal transduction histidine kinase
MRLPDDFDIVGAIRTVARQFKSEAAERHITFRLELPTTPIIMWGEKTAIQQAIGQLLSNAIKYSFGGNDVTIHASQSREEVEIRVQNRGHPLPTGLDLKKIWDYGFRGPNAKELHVNGSGIGLYSAKKIVTAHHGWVHAEADDKTTRFSMHLPSKFALKRDLGILV